MCPALPYPLVAQCVGFMKPMVFDINEVMPHMHVTVEVHGAWRGAIAMRVMKAALLLLRWLKIDASVTLRSKP